MYRVYFDPGFYIDVHYDAQVRKQYFNRVEWEYINKIKTGDYLEFIWSHNQRYYSKNANSYRNKFVGKSMTEMFDFAWKNLHHIRINTDTDYIYNKNMKKLL